MTTETTIPQCPCCGEEFATLKAGGNIPAHSWPEPCRQVCPGSGEQPKRKKSALWKDDPEQRVTDFLSRCELEIHLYGFAIVKEVATLRGQPNGEMKCPLCGNTVRYSIAECNGHCNARCGRPGCINAME